MTAVYGKTQTIDGTVEIRAIIREGLAAQHRGVTYARADDVRVAHEVRIFDKDTGQVWIGWFQPVPSFGSGLESSLTVLSDTERWPEFEDHCDEVRDWLAERET